METPGLPNAVPATQLRVYEPLRAFPPEQRRAWARYAASPPAEQQLQGYERAESWRRVVRGPRPPSGPHRSGFDGSGAARAAGPGSPPGSPRDTAPDAARVLLHDGDVLLCPLQLSLRYAAAAREAARQLPPELAEATGALEWPAEEAGKGGDVRLRTLVAAWDLPWAWAALVRPDDAAAPARGTYLVPMATARRRAARALRRLRDAFGDIRVTHEAEDLARWLEDFHPRSVIELDDRPVVKILGESPGEALGDVRLGLECLAEGDMTGMAAAYTRVTRRAKRLHLLAAAS